MFVPKKMAAFAVVLVIFTCFGLWYFSREKTESGRNLAAFDLQFDGVPLGVRSTRVFSWLSSGRSRFILIAEMSPLESLAMDYLDRDDILDLIDVRCGWGASSLEEITRLMGDGGFVVRKKGGELVGFFDKQKTHIVVPASNAL